MLTLALGIGANTAIFTLFEAILLRPLPIQAPHELYFVAHGTAPSSNYPYFERIRARTDLFSGVSGYSRANFKVSAGDRVEVARGQFVSGNYHASWASRSPSDEGCRPMTIDREPPRSSP